MGQYSKAELEGALRVVSSTIRKCEKIQEKQTLGLSQQTLLCNRIKALHIASDLITKEIAKTD